MKHVLPLLLAFVAVATPIRAALQDIEIGPNGGRIFKLESKATPRIEVVAKDGKFVVSVLDEKNKPVPIGERTLTVTAGQRSNPEKVAVEKVGETFTAAIPKGENVPVVFQIRDTQGGKSFYGRMTYDTSDCGGCQRQEWLCDCGAKAKKPSA